MSAWESESCSGLTGARAAPSELSTKTPVETVGNSQQWLSSVQGDTEAQGWTGSFRPSLCVLCEYLT